MFRKEKYHVKRLLLLVALILFTIIAICSVSRISKLCDEIEEGNNEECTDLLQEWWLNDDEKEFLIFNCVDEEATRDQIMKGTLPEWKHDLVYWYRKAMEHLTENYPNTKFTLTTYEYITSGLIKFYAIAENNDNMAFTVMVDQDSGHVTDTYYE